MSRTRRRSQHYVHPKYRPMPKWWREHVPVVGDLIETEEPVRYNYPVERTGLEESGIFTPEMGIIAALVLTVGYAWFSDRYVTPK